MTGDYPMQRVAEMQLARRCYARTRQHSLCQSPAMPNGRCRMHGGKSLSGTAHGRYKHGEFTRAAIASRRKLRAFFAASLATLKEL